MSRHGSTPTYTVKKVEWGVEVQGSNHGGKGGRQHGNCDNHLMATKLVGEEGVVRRRGRGSREEVVENSNRVSWMTRYCRDGENWRGDDCLMSLGPPNDNEEAWGRLDDITMTGMP